MRKLAWPLAVAVLAAAAPASAHIVLDSKSAAVGASFKATLRVTHGCDGAATTGLKVKLPEGFVGVKPMPKPGWSLATTKAPYARSYAFYHGRTLSEGVVEIVWSGGSLPDDFVDEFSVVGFVARELKAGERLVFPVTQECEGGKTVAWVELGHGAHGHPDHPAPTLELTARP